MISSSSPALERGLDTMVLVYSLLQGHPAATACEQLLRAHSGWFTSTAVFFEAKSVLTKVYGEDPLAVTHLDASGTLTLRRRPVAEWRGWAARRCRARWDGERGCRALSLWPRRAI